MTIAAAYLTSEGVVLGADSAVTISVNNPSGPQGVLQVLRHTQKVFEISDKPGEGRFGLCTWGSGSICGVSHRTIVAKVADEIKEDTSVDKVCDLVSGEINDIINDNEEWKYEVGYYIGGWDIGKRFPVCFRLRIDTEGTIEKHEMKLGEGSFSGAPIFFTRVFRGYDPNLKNFLTQSLRKRLGTVPENFEELVTQAFDEASAPLVSTGYRDLPIREAIDWVHSYLHLTIKTYKFQFGVPVCGGPIEIGFVTTDRLFRWVCHKPFDSAIREEDP